MRNLYSIFVLGCILSFGFSAEAEASQPIFETMPVSGHLRAPASQDEALWFSYYKNGGKLSVAGLKKAETYHCAISIPEAFAGKKIDAVAVYLYNKTVVSNVKGWASTELPIEAEDANLGFAKADQSALINYQHGPNIIEFSTATKIPEGGCYAGYTFTVDDISDPSGQNPIIYCYDQEPVDGAFFVRSSVSMNTWQNFNSPSAQRPGNLIVMARINGVFYTNAVRIDTPDSHMFINKNESQPFELSITGFGKNAVKSVTFATDGVDGETVELEQQLGFGRTTTISMPVEAGPDAGHFKRIYSVSRVNGEPAEGDQNTILDVTVLTNKVRRKIVAESVTGTGWDAGPVELTAIPELVKKYNTEPDAPVLIFHSMHLCNQEDPMFAPEFAPIANYYTMENMVDCMFDREQLDKNGCRVTDIWFGKGETDLGVCDEIDRIAAIPAEAEVIVSPRWSADGNSIEFDTDVTFFFDNEKDSDYGIAYVVTETEQKSDHYLWRQSNLFSGLDLPADDPFYSWSEQPRLAENITYYNVAIDNAGLANGLNKSISSPIVEGEAQHHSHTMDLTSKIKAGRIQKRENVRATAMLIDRTTGIIVNADCKPVAAAGEDGLTAAGVSGEASVVARYTIDGRKIDRPQPGVIIEVFSDGTRRKIFIK